MNNFKLYSAILLFAMVFFAGCSSKPKTMGTSQSEDIFGKLRARAQELESKQIPTAVATASSQELQTAIDKVELECRGQMVRAVESKVATLQKRFKEEVGDEHLDHFSSVTKSVSSRILNGTKLIESPYQENKDGTFRAFGLMIMDIKLFKETLDAEMAANEAMKTRWLASKAYKELDEEVKEFEKFKADQKAGIMGQKE